MAAPLRFAEAENELHDAAAAYAGLDDFGPQDYRTGFRKLLSSLDIDTQLTPIGREFAAGTLVGTLAARLHTQEGWKRHPECLKQPISRPLIITGIPRTGTTVLHKLLSIDPQFQGLEHWLSDTPMPRPPREQWDSNPHFQATVAGLDAFFNAVPEMRAAHLMTAHEVDECLELLKQGFVTNRFSSGWNVPSYDTWFQQQSERASYQRYADTLKLIGATDGRRWLLKNPGHIAQLDLLLEVFPDACVVQTHRDPVKAVPSLCSVLAMSRRTLEGDNVNPKLIGKREAIYWHGAVTRAMTVRQRAPKQFFDVVHRRFHAEPLRVVRELYDHFGLQLSDTTENTMREWLSQNPSNKLGEHIYTLEPFDLTPEYLRDLYKDYVKNFVL